MQQLLIWLKVQAQPQKAPGILFLWSTLTMDQEQTNLCKNVEKEHKLYNIQLTWSLISDSSSHQCPPSEISPCQLSQNTSLQSNRKHSRLSLITLQEDPVTLFTGLLLIMHMKGLGRTKSEQIVYLQEFWEKRILINSRKRLKYSDQKLQEKEKEMFQSKLALGASSLACPIR